MLSQMPASLSAEWEYFFQLEPAGALVEELRFGQICAVLANINSTSKSKTYSAYDFLTTVNHEKPQQSVEDMFGALKGVIGGRN